MLFLLIIMVYLVQLHIIVHLDFAFLGIRAVLLGSCPKACSRLFQAWRLLLKYLHNPGIQAVLEFHDLHTQHCVTPRGSGKYRAAAV